MQESSLVKRKSSVLSGLFFINQATGILLFLQDFRRSFPARLLGLSFTLFSALVSHTCIAATPSERLSPHQGSTVSDEAVYFTNGVHNKLGCSKANNHCIAKREKTAPSDPRYPKHWISDWTMFRVTQNYEKNPPPYTNPPATLSSSDYTVSFGTTYYDSEYKPKDGDGKGAMMEHYEDYCLPIFPIANNRYTCSFISLGNKAYFLTYKKDRPKGMPECCLFSPKNHPPRRDFIKHLPYSPTRSAQLNNSVQAYALEVPSPDGPILFGYAFNAVASPDDYGKEHYRHPQSFFFSGNSDKAKAPIVSQNYTSFRKQKPESRFTWDRVERMCKAKPLPDCQLFNYDAK